MVPALSCFYSAGEGDHHQLQTSNNFCPPTCPSPPLRSPPYCVSTPSVEFLHTCTYAKDLLQRILRAAKREAQASQSQHAAATHSHKRMPATKDGEGQQFSHKRPKSCRPVHNGGRPWRKRHNITAPEGLGSAKGANPPPCCRTTASCPYTHALSTTRCWRKGPNIHSQNNPSMHNCGNRTPGTLSRISTTSLAKFLAQTCCPETQIRKIVFGQQNFFKFLKHFRCSPLVDLFTNHKDGTGGCFPPGPTPTDLFSRRMHQIQQDFVPGL